MTPFKVLRELKGIAFKMVKCKRITTSFNNQATKFKESACISLWSLNVNAITLKLNSVWYNWIYWIIPFNVKSFWFYSLWLQYMAFFFLLNLLNFWFRLKYFLFNIFFLNHQICNNVYANIQILSNY